MRPPGGGIGGCNRDDVQVVRKGTASKLQIVSQFCDSDWNVRAAIPPRCSVGKPDVTHIVEQIINCRRFNDIVPIAIHCLILQRRIL